MKNISKPLKEGKTKNNNRKVNNQTRLRANPPPSPKKNKMKKTAQEFLIDWEKENNPFYPNEIRWDRLRVNQFLNDYDVYINS